MTTPWITLTTDFGEDSPYVAAMKGVILGVNPDVRLLDLSHQIPPQDVRHAGFFLAAAVPCFPPGVLHVVVVDPGVGSERAVLYVEVDGRRLLVPDNGCWTTLPRETAPRVIRLAEPRFWRHPVSATFHGRDIFAPTAGHLSRGLDPRELGPAVSSWVQLPTAAPQQTRDALTGEVVFVDHFGNLITNIPAAWVTKLGAVVVGEETVTRWVRTYADAEPGTMVALISSTGHLEIAVAQGHAARRLGVAVGTPVTVRLALS
jgi:S-adenosyl-L-methionine hydrolase (adenosine-forming)